MKYTPEQQKELNKREYIALAIIGIATAFIIKYNLWESAQKAVINMPM